MSEAQNKALRVQEGPWKVCIVGPIPPPYGGIAHWVKSVTEALGATPFWTIAVVDTAVRDRPVDDWRLWRRVLLGSRRVCRDLKGVWSFARRRAGVIHIVSSGEIAFLRDIAVILIAKFYRRRVYLHFHFGRVPVVLSTWTYERLLLWLAVKCRPCMVVLDVKTEKALRSHTPNLSVVRLPNFVSFFALNLVQSRVVRKPIVIYIGWLIPTKGITELFLAWKRLKPDGWCLRLVGPVDSAYRRSLEESLGGIVEAEFVGALPHYAAMQQLAEAEVLVLPSYTEGFPNVILEAMAMGKAIIGTAVGAIPEMLSDGCGTVVPPQSEHALSVALSSLISSPALRADLGREAASRARERYDQEVVLAKLLDLWSSDSWYNL